MPREQQSLRIESRAGLSLKAKLDRHCKQQKHWFKNTVEHLETILNWLGFEKSSSIKQFISIDNCG
jgi:hypothetical protein